MMEQLKPLNPQLYQILESSFGSVKTEKQGRRNLWKPGFYRGKPRARLIESGETYRCNCPHCSDTKYHLYINHECGRPDPCGMGKIWMAICYRCGPKTDLLRDCLAWTKFSNEPLVGREVVVEETPVEQVVSPGTCIRIDQVNDPRIEVGASYLSERGIDPVEAGKVFGVSFCIHGNPDVYYGGCEGRIIIPMFRDRVLVGWQARLAKNLPKHEADKSFQTLRYWSMPGAGWRSRNLFGFDQATPHDYCVVVEGPTDMLKQGPPCIGTAGQTLSYAQAELIASVWGSRRAVVLAGDSVNKGKGTEKTQQDRTMDMLSSICSAPVYRLELPHGDPGDWQREEFFELLEQCLSRPPTKNLTSSNGGVRFG